MYFSKTRDVKSPSRGTNSSAGIDFYIPIFTKSFLKDLKEKNKGRENEYQLNETLGEIIINPHGSILIPSGIHVNLARTKADFKPDWPGIMLVAHNKSGVSSKKGLDRMAEVVDEDYQGEIHINLRNTTDDYVNISQDEKVIQFILEEVIYAPPIEVDFNKLYDSLSERGSGGFGHTDKIN